MALCIRARKQGQLIDSNASTKEGPMSLGGGALLVQGPAEAVVDEPRCAPMTFGRSFRDWSLKRYVVVRPRLV